MKKKVLALSLAGGLLIGTFAFVASSQKLMGGGFNFVDASNCEHNHVEHHAKVTPTLATSGVSEYWCCCDCHTSFKNSTYTEAFENTSGSPTDPTDGRYLAALGESIEKGFTSDNVVASSEAVPEGYVFDKTYSLSGANIYNIFNEKYIVDGATKISFALKTSTKWFACHGSWDYGPNSWKIFEVVNKGESTWDIYSANAGSDLVLKHSDVSGNNLKTILDLTCENDESYTTNLKVDITRKTVIAESALFKCESVDGMTLPLDFTQVSKATLNGASSFQGQKFIDDISIDGVSSCEFAFLTKNRKFSWAGWADALAMNTWHLAKFTIDNDGVDCSLCLIDGTVKYTYENATSLREALPYYNYDGDADPMEFYCTEVRGVINKEESSLTIIDNCLVSANGAVATSIRENCPDGFTKASLYTPGGATSSSTVYSAADISGYSLVKFGIRTGDYMLYNGWGGFIDNIKWSIVTLTNNNDGTWDMGIVDERGTSLYSQEDMPATDPNPGTRTNNSLNMILNNFYVQNKDTATNMKIVVSEVRGILAE